MNEKEAREIIKTDIIPCGNAHEAYYSYAKGFLEGLEQCRKEERELILRLEKLLPSTGRPDDDK